MKILIVILCLLTFVSCKHTEAEKTLVIYYQDGSNEELTLTDTKEGLVYARVNVYFHDGCLYKTHIETKYDANYQGCIRCGVKSYSVIKDYKNY